jgi:hypothetical protein
MKLLFTEAPAHSAEETTLYVWLEYESRVLGEDLREKAMKVKRARSGREITTCPTEKHFRLLYV